MHDDGPHVKWRMANVEELIMEAMDLCELQTLGLVRVEQIDPSLA